MLNEEVLLNRVLDRQDMAQIKDDLQSVSRLRQAYAHLLQSTSYAKLIEEAVFERLLVRAIFIWFRCVVSVENPEGIENFVGTTLRESFAAVIDEWLVDVQAVVPEKVERAMTHLDMDGRADSYAVLLQYNKLYGPI